VRNIRGASDAGVGPFVSVDYLLELTALLGFAEDLDQDLQEALGGVPVLGSVVRVELGYRERTHTPIARQRAQYLAVCPQRWGGAAIRVLRQRRVEEVDEVDVEVDGQTVTGGERSEGGSGAAERIGGGALHVDHGPPSVGDHLSLKVRVRAEPDEADLPRAQHRALTGERCESIDGAVDVEHVRHPHPVQGVVDRAAWHVEISVPIDLDQTQPRAAFQQSGDGADTNGAISPEHHNRVPGWS